MSCSLHWSPLPTGQRVGDPGLRNAIQEEFGMPCQLGFDALPFLRGLRAAKLDGAKELIEAIEQHETIRLWTEC